jgi:predicted DNA-binding protein
MRRVSLFIPQEMMDGLEALKETYGTPAAGSIRRAIAAYLDQQGTKPAEKGRRSRKRK